MSDATPDELRELDRLCRTYVSKAEKRIAELEDALAAAERERDRLREVVETAKVVWDTIPAHYDPESQSVKDHAAALNAMRDALAKLERSDE